MSNSKRKRHLLLILLATGVVRVGAMLWSWSGWYGLPQYGMSKLYFREGYGIAAGYGLIQTRGATRQHLIDLYERVSRDSVRVTPEMAGPLPSKDETAPSMLHPPGFALLVAGFNRTLGVRADEPMQVLGILLELIAAGLVYWVAATLVGARAGLLAGLIYAFFLPLAYHAAYAKEPQGLHGVFIVGCLAGVLQATRVRGWQALAWYAAGGVVLGLGSYIRPDYMLLPVFMVVGLWAYTRRFLRSVGAMVLVQLLVFATLLPWAYRNYRACGRWVFTSTGVGATLVTGLGEFENAWGIGGSDIDRGNEARAMGFESPWSSESDLYFREVFFKSVRERPGEYLSIVTRRLPLAIATPFRWGLANPYRTQRFGEAATGGEDRYEVIRKRPWYVIAAYWDCMLPGGVMLAGLMCACIMLVRERRRAGMVLLLMSPHLYGIATHVLVHFEPRFILPSAFCWFIALGYVLARGGRSTTRQQLPERAA